MGKRIKARTARPAPRAKVASSAKTGSSAKAMPQLISTRMSRIIFIVVAFIVILLMIMAMMPGSLSAPS